MSNDRFNFFPRGTLLLAMVLAIWLGAVGIAASKGIFEVIPSIYFGPMVALGIVLPFGLYLAMPSVKSYFERIGVYPLTVLHVWRIPAALAFFWYGFHGQLPPAFWVLAGVGDLLAGLYVLPLLNGPVPHSRYRRMHVFGFADFVVAVGTGLLFTLLDDPRMATIRELPMILIPLFGVGVSGACHLIAFDLLRRDRHEPRDGHMPIGHSGGLAGPLSDRAP